MAAADVEQLQMLVDAVAAPAYVLDRHWNAVAWSLGAEALLSGWLGKSAAAHPNLLRYVFLDPGAQRFIIDWAARAERLVAELYRGSVVFEHTWSANRVVAREGAGAASIFPAARACSSNSR